MRIHLLQVTTSFEIYHIFLPICPLPLLMLVHIMYQMLKDIIHLLHYRSTTMDTEMLYSGYNFVSVSTKGFVLFCFLNHFFGLVFGMTTMP